MSFLIQQPEGRLAGSLGVLDDIAAELPSANALGGVVDLLGLLHEVDPAEARTEAAVARAFMIVSFLAHSYVWSIPEGYDEIPDPLAARWVSLASRLELPPVLTYSSYILDNFKPALAGDALVPAISFTGSPDEAWFIHVHQLIERAGAPIVAVATQGDRLRRDPDLTSNAITSVASCLEAMCAEARKMRDGCDPYIYFHRVRRYLYGWKWNPIFGNRRMSYRGIREEVLPLAGQYSGESGSQSPLLPLVDALLGVEHTEPFAGFASEMTPYMYPRHRALFRRVRETRHQLTPISRETTEAFVRALEALHDFRSIHLGFAQSYILDQVEQSDTASSRAAGTGGSTVIDALSGARAAVVRRLQSVGTSASPH